jgi:hypothetical protein
MPAIQLPAALRLHDVDAALRGLLPPAMRDLIPTDVSVTTLCVVPALVFLAFYLRRRGQVKTPRLRGPPR